MLENCESAKERWGGVNSMVDRWLQERQDMLVQYCNISAKSEVTSNTRDPAYAEQLRRLCQIMVDYVSAGHFEVYDQLLQESKEFNDTQALTEASELFQQVEQTTDAVLDFNDKYQETDDLSAISRDLSEVGETLATRFEAEDRMIEVLHMAHKDLVA